MRLHPLYLVVGDETLHDRFGIGSGYQDVEIADGLPTAPVAAGNHDALDPLGAFEPGGKGLGIAGGGRQLDAVPGAQVGLQGRDDGRLGLGAKAGQFAQAPVLGGTCRCRQIRRSIVCYSTRPICCPCR